MCKVGDVLFALEPLDKVISEITYVEHKYMYCVIFNHNILPQH